ncbi:copper homeostasis protein CutC [Humibacter antri]
MTRTGAPEIEIAVQDLEGVRIALDEGADRVELCSALGVGGLTPSAGLIERAAALSRERGRDGFVHVLIRPRSGGFFYSVDELDVMLRDIRQARELGAGGVVVGLIDKHGNVDVSSTAALVSAAGALPVTYHRAIDVARDASSAVQALAAVGVRRILTSGTAAHAIDGLPMLRSLVERAAGVVQIMAGGGVTADQLPMLTETGVDAVHLSARMTVTGQASGPGGGHPEYDATDADAVRAVMQARQSLATPAD